MEAGFDQGGDRVALFVVDPDHLLGMPVLGAADVAFLERGRPIVERQHQAVVDSLLCEHASNHVGLGIAAHAADQRDLGTQ